VEGFHAVKSLFTDLHIHSSSVQPKPSFLSYETKQVKSISSANGRAFKPYCKTQQTSPFPNLSFLFFFSLLLFGSVKCLLWTAKPNIWIQTSCATGREEKTMRKRLGERDSRRRRRRRRRSDDVEFEKLEHQRERKIF